MTADEYCFEIVRNGLVNVNQLHELHAKVRGRLANNQYAYALYIIPTFDFVRKHVLREQTPKHTLFDMFSSANSLVQIDLRELFAYFHVVQSFINLKIKQHQTLICYECHESTDILEINDGEYFCNHCGLVCDSRSFGNKDIETINTTKSYYSLKINLLKTLQKHNNVFIADQDRTKLQQVFEEEKLNIKNIKLNHFLYVLKKHKLDHLIANAKAIYNSLKNAELNLLGKISSNLPKILKLHEEYKLAYRRVKNPNRTNSLTLSFIMFKFLRLCDIDCELGQICTLRTDQKIDEHEAKWHEICAITGWPSV